MRNAPMELASAVQRYEIQLRQLTAAVKREAFIVSRLVEAVKELQNFQKSVAVDRARDRIGEAQKRAAEDPRAPIQVSQSLGFMRELLDHAREQGATADTEALQKEIMLRSHDIQMVLFGEISAAQKDRRALSEMQMKLATIAGDMDAAVTDALGTTFDYFRAGGK